jgi:hypothetical protein
MIDVSVNAAAVVEIAQKLRKNAGLPDEPTGEELVRVAEPAASLPAVAAGGACPDEPALVGEDDRVDAIAEAELREDACDV